MTLTFVNIFLSELYKQLFILCKKLFQNILRTFLFLEYNFSHKKTPKIVLYAYLNVLSRFFLPPGPPSLINGYKRRQLLPVLRFSWWPFLVNSFIRSVLVNMILGLLRLC